MRHYIAVSIAISLFAVPWLATAFPDQANFLVASLQNFGDQLAAVVIHNPRTIAQLQDKYVGTPGPSSPKIRVLVMPGHEPGYGGAEYGDLKEREMTVQLANELAKFLNNNSKYETIVPRTESKWSPTFETYFKNYGDSIIQWQKDHRQESLLTIANSPTKQAPVPHVIHNSAPYDVAYRLYGITKWSNENNIDIAIHVHFNDYPGHGGAPGQYTGFAIYTPSEQYQNSTTTRAIAQSVFKRLQKYNPVSNLPGEKDGIIDEHELIAIGANNTADAASMLIEYGYIYEPQFTNPATRDIAIRDLAYQTYLGLEDFFHPGQSMLATNAYDTLILPHTWNTNTLSENTALVSDVYALQTALLVDGVYPPRNRTKNDCQRTGTIGPCTKAAIGEFQDKYGLGATGTIGPKTIDKLNGLYSSPYLIKPI